jgi:SAM-dependent methyltransferase
MNHARTAALAGLALVLVLLLPASSSSQGEERPKVKVGYWPTPQEIVDKMLELAKVTKDDVVYDLGCGDGRIVVAAAKKHGARAVGVDIDPKLLGEARANVKAAKVEDLVTIRKEDLFKTDITGATVVTLYLNDKANLALMPILKKSLKPGARIVSQTWDMGDWKPDKTISATGIDEKERTKHEYKLYLWIIGKPEGKGKSPSIDTRRPESKKRWEIRQ